MDDFLDEKEALTTMVDELCAYMREYEDIASLDITKKVVAQFKIESEEFKIIEKQGENLGPIYI